MKLWSQYALVIALSTVSIPTHAAEENDNSGIRATLGKAFEHSPALKAARLETEAMAQRRRQAFSLWYPQIKIEGTLYSTDLQSSNFSNGNGATTKHGGISINQQIYDGGRTSAETSRSRLLLDLSHQELNNVENQVLLEAASAHIELLRNSLLYQSALKSEQRVWSELTGAQKRYQAGETSITDVYQSQASFDNATAQRAIRFTNLAKSRSGYEFTTNGQPPDFLYLPDLPVPLPANVQSAQEMAVQHSGNINIARITKELTRLQIDISRADLRPHLGVYAAYSKEYDPQPGIVDDTQEKQIGLQAQLALYDGGLARSKINESRIRVQKDQENIYDVEENIRENVTSIWLSLQAYNNLKIARLSEYNANIEALKAVQAEMMMGERSMLDVLDTQQKLSLAEDNYIGMRCDELITAYRMLGAMGVLNQDL